MVSMRAIALVSCFFLGACTGLTGAARPAFDQVAFNQPWYGAYHRPLPERDHHAEAGARASRRADERDERRAAREEERQAAADARAARNDRDASTPPSNVTASVTPASEVAIPDARGGRFDAELAAAYVRDVYALNETAIGDGTMDVVDIYRWVQEHGQVYHTPRPAVGDLVFFHNTHDANADERPNDWYTHVGLVESVDANDTVTVLSFVDGAVGRVYLNRHQPGEERDGGRVINTPLRPERRGEPEHMQRLAGDLFAGFGSLLGERTQVIVLDVWQPADSPTLQASR